MVFNLSIATHLEKLPLAQSYFSYLFVCVVMNVCMCVHVCFLISACVEVVNELNAGVTVAVSGERLYAQ